MKYKLFGPGESPTDQFLTDLETLASLPPSDLDRIAMWFEKAEQFAPIPWDDVAQLAGEVTIDSEKLNTVLHITRFILNSWHKEELTLSEVLGDIKQAGCSGEALSNIEGFLSRLEKAKARVQVDVSKNVWAQFGPRNLSDANIALDIRPVFGDYAYTDSPRNEQYLRLLGHTYSVICELELVSSSGDSESVSFQMSERSFERLVKALLRAQEQLAVVKGLKFKKQA